MLKLPRKIPQGSILVEAMAATIILSLVMIASTPAIFMAITTRVQARRVAASIQLAQQQVDYVRELITSGNYSCSSYSGTACISTYLPPDVGSTSRSGLSSTNPPNNSTTCTVNPCTSATQAAIVSLNGQNFLVQTFRTTGVNLSTTSGSVQPTTGTTQTLNNPYTSYDVPIAFRMGVRVYSTTAISNLQNGGTLVVGQSGSSIGLSSNEKQQSQAPLVTLYVDFVRVDLANTLATYQTFVAQ